jgi:hypothetical protein
MFSDNSITHVNYQQMQPLYYCDKCNKIFDGEALDLENKYTELLLQEYISWFTKENEEYKNKLIDRFEEGLTTPLGYWQEDKDVYDSDKWGDETPNTYWYWLNFER